MATKILFIDDEVQTLNALRRSLRGYAYEILVAEDGPSALELIRHHEISIIVCDQRMPGMNGAEVLAKSIELRPDAIRITLTGYTDLSSIQASINEGQVSRFLLKPWDDSHLRAVVEDAVHQYETKLEVRRLNELTLRQNKQLEKWSGELENKVLERTAALYMAHEETLDALILALDVREQSTAGHSRRVAIYCLYLAIQAGVSPDEIENIYRGALLHDMGKIGVPDAILLKTGELTRDERHAVQQHVIIGGQILEGIDYLKSAVAIPRYHHERYDGKGYSEGLAGDAIPLPARLFSVVDVYDALRSERPYKKALTHNQACEIIVAESGGHFDSAIVEVFRRIPPLDWDTLAQAAGQETRFTQMIVLCQKLLGKDESKDTAA